MSRLIAFNALAGGGKTTAANHLVNKYNAVRLSFAQPIRDMLAAMGLEPAGFNEGKEQPSEILGGKTPRFAMQTLGTEWGRDTIDKNLWLNLLTRRARQALSEGRVVVVDDVRFENEADAIHELGGVVIEIVRPGLSRGSHVSENGVPGAKLDGQVFNTGTLEEFCRAVDYVIRHRIDPPESSPPLAKDWIQTFTGRQFFPCAPTVDSIYIEDIAHALSNLCRFSGHSRTFYSVAQHSLIVASLLPYELQLAGLLHDATEAYLVDIPRPLKNVLPEYRAIEARLAAVIERRFGVDFDNARIKEADNIALVTEARDLFGRPAAPWELHEKPADFTIVPMGPGEAASAFLLRYHQLTEAARPAVA